MKIWLFLIFILIIYVVLSFREGPDILPNFHQVNSFLYRGGEPKEEGIRKLKQMGIRTIIDLDDDLFENEPSEVERERRWARQAGLEFAYMPLHPLRAPQREQVDKVLALLQDPRNHPVYLHCDLGMNRTGFIVGVYRVKVEGWRPREAYEEMVGLGFYGHRLFWWNKPFFRYVSQGQPK